MTIYAWDAEELMCYALNHDANITLKRAHFVIEMFNSELGGKDFAKLPDLDNYHMAVIQINILAELIPNLIKYYSKTIANMRSADLGGQTDKLTDIMSFIQNDSVIILDEFSLVRDDHATKIAYIEEQFALFNRIGQKETK